MAGCMLNGRGAKEASYYESRMSVLEGSAWHSPVDLPIHPVTRLPWIYLAGHTIYGKAT
jgi:hypothetical protein